MRVVVISDTHMQHDDIDIPDCSLLIHAGDGSNYRDPYENEHEMRDFIQWFARQPAKRKIYVPGNHDTAFEKGLMKEWVEDYKKVIDFLVHESIEIDGLKIFGSPYTPSFGMGWAYNVKRTKLQKYWNEIPEDTDILVTHGPPMYINDLTENPDGTLEQVGCKSLYNRVMEVQPDYHIFGHIHDEKNAKNHGIKTIGDKHNTAFINASIVDLRYKVVNKPIEFYVGWHDI